MQSGFYFISQKKKTYFQKEKYTKETKAKRDMNTTKGATAPNPPKREIKKNVGVSELGQKSRLKMSIAS
jgi:hypothetical protein